MIRIIIIIQLVTSGMSMKTQYYKYEERVDFGVHIDIRLLQNSLVNLSFYLKIVLMFVIR